MEMDTRTRTVKTTTGSRLVRLAFAIFAAVFTLCLSIQVFLAGLAVFASPENWERHEAFVHYFQPLPLVMLALSFFGGLPVKFRWQSAALFGLIYVQYFTAHYHEISVYVSAAHPVIAMGLFGLAFMVMYEARRHI